MKYIVKYFNISKITAKGSKTSELLENNYILYIFYFTFNISGHFTILENFKWNKS